MLNAFLWIILTCIAIVAITTAAIFIMGFIRAVKNEIRRARRKDKHQ